MTNAHVVVLSTAVIAVAGLAADVSTQGGAPASSRCSVARIQAGAPKDTTVSAASLVEATDGVPRHCRVDGQVAVPGNTVNFRLGLPETWNGKFYFQGVGGTGGTIGSLNTGLARGYASASTDTGHESSDTTWGSEPREGDRLRSPRHARHDGRGQGAERGVLRQAARPGLLQRLLERRTPGADGSAALSDRLHRDHRGRPGNRHADAGRTRARLPAHAEVRGELPDRRQGRTPVEGHARGVRQDGRSRGRAHHRPAAVHVQARDAEVRRRRCAQLSDGRTARNRAADLLAGEDSRPARSTRRASRSDTRVDSPDGAPGSRATRRRSSRPTVRSRTAPRCRAGTA